MTIAPELKPCPFCGGKPYLANVEMVGCAYVVCTDCRTQSDDMSKERAIATWNTRTDTIPDPMQDPRVVALVEGVKGLRTIIEEIDGAIIHGTWRDEHGRRLKDTPAWVKAYVALSAITKEPPDER